MKKVLCILLALVSLAFAGTFAACSSDDTIIVQTNAYFAPFEYFQGTYFAGVDMQIAKLFAQALGLRVNELRPSLCGICCDDDVEPCPCRSAADAMIVIPIA